MDVEGQQTVVQVDGGPPLTFTLHRTHRHRPFWVPDRLPSLPDEQALATVVLPHHVDWSTGGAARPLADPKHRWPAYQEVLTEGRPEDIARYVDGALLVVIWPLFLPAEIRAAWEPLVADWMASVA